MNEQQKAQVKADLHSGASRVAAKANRKAKEAVGWRRWVYAAVAIVAGAVAFFTATSCTVSFEQSATGGIRFSGTVIEPEPFRK